MDKPKKPEKEGLRPLPKPIQLDLPNARPKQVRRLHETDSLPQSNSQEDDKHVPELKVKSPPPSREAPKHKSNTGKGFFDSAQKAYGQRRSAPKPSKQKRAPRQSSPTGPMLGKGDRLYTPPQPKAPLFPPHVKRILRLWALGLIGLAFVVMGLINVFSYNAWAIYLDEQFLGYMPINREAETYTVHDAAVQHLTEFLGAEVRVNQVVTVHMARASRNDIYTAPDMIRRISQSFDPEIIASAIYIDGERVAVLRNEQEAQNVADEIMRRFTNENTITELSRFEEDWQIVRVAVAADMEDMDSSYEVIQLLERPVRDIHRHIIRGGDTQGALAVEFNTTLNSIGELNDITSDAILRVGNTLLIEITRPRLTVVTVDEVTSLEVEPMEVETRENPNMHTSVTTVLNEGRDGERRVVQRITRVNGAQTGAPEIISSSVLTPPETRIVEVGTSETTIQVR